MRVAEPQPLDFALIAQRVIENNMGIGGIRVEADVNVVDGRVVFPGTGQSFPLAAGATLEEGAGHHRFDVIGFDLPVGATLRPLTTPAPPEQ